MEERAGPEHTVPEQTAPHWSHMPLRGTAVIRIGTSGRIPREHLVLAHPFAPNTPTSTPSSPTQATRHLSSSICHPTPPRAHNLMGVMNYENIGPRVWPAGTLWKTGEGCGALKETEPGKECCCQGAMGDVRGSGGEGARLRAAE